jgi:hypothetical protein
VRRHTKVHHKIRHFQREVSADVVKSESLREVIAFDEAPVLLNGVLLIKRKILLLIGGDSSFIVCLLREEESSSQKEERRERTASSDPQTSA